MFRKIIKLNKKSNKYKAVNCVNKKKRNLTYIEPANNLQCKLKNVITVTRFKTGISSFEKVF